MELWCAFVLEFLSLSLVCECARFSKKKKEWVIIPHCLRKCVVCSIIYPILPQKLPWLLSGVVVCFCVRTHFPLPCVCVFVSPKKKKKPMTLYYIKSHSLYPKKKKVILITFGKFLKSYTI